MTAPRDTAGGFTLIETLIAVTLLGLLATLLLGGVGLGTRVMEISRKHSEQTSRLSTVYGFLRTQLSQAQPILRAASTAERPLVDFDGRGDGLTLTGPAPAYLTAAAHQSLAIVLDRSGAAARLVAAWTPLGAISSGGGRSAILFEDLTAIEFAYFGSPDGRQPPVWQSEWRNRSSLPARIRLRVALRNQPSPPELVVALPLSNADL